MKQVLFTGAAAALITPFRDGAPDLPALHTLIDRLISNGTAALIVCGTTGEPATMTADERVSVIRETVSAAAGRVPVICGTGSNCTSAVIETEKLYRDLGCDAQLVVTPYYNKATQEGVYAHFMTIAEHTELPVILYNVPGRTNVDIAPDTIGRLAKCERIIAIKESSYDVPSIMRKMAAAGDELTFYSGNDDMVYPLLALGAKGVISVVSNVYPRAMADLCAEWFCGKAEEALRIQQSLLPLIRALFAEVNPIPVKYAARLLGLCDGSLRLPLTEASAGVADLLRRELTACGLL